MLASTPRRRRETLRNIHRGMSKPDGSIRGETRIPGRHGLRPSRPHTAPWAWAWMTWRTFFMSRPGLCISGWPANTTSRTPLSNCCGCCCVMNCRTPIGRAGIFRRASCIRLRAIPSVRTIRPGGQCWCAARKCSAWSTASSASFARPGGLRRGQVRRARARARPRRSPARPTQSGGRRSRPA